MPSEYMTLNEAAEKVGVSRVTLWRRIRESELPTFQSQQDRRSRLVKRADVQKMMQPKLIVHTPDLTGGKLAA